MNLINGKLITNEEALETIETLGESILLSRMSAPIDTELVISACEKLAEAIDRKEIISLLENMGFSGEKADAALAEAMKMLSPAYLRERIRLELGDLLQERKFTPFGENKTVLQKRMPLGVLFHIAAGNVDALPAYSVIEGLLTGNINILKLPTGEDGLSLYLLHELEKCEPKLIPYIYVYDFPSNDTKMLEVMAEQADAIVVWGGDAAVLAARKLAKADTQLIEWGHKISFAYISGEADKETIDGIAENIIATGQHLCSSCQGVFLDTSDFSEAKLFAEKLLSALDERLEEIDSFALAKRSLSYYTDEILHIGKDFCRLQGRSAEVAVYPDTMLLPSYGAGSCWVKLLPKENILKVLSPYKNHLQTAALFCGEKERPLLEELLLKTGIVKLCSPLEMSKNYCGEAHDGQYPLARYTKIVSIQR